MAMIHRQKSRSGVNARTRTSESCIFDRNRLNVNMTPALNALNAQLSNNQLSVYYTEQLFASMSETIKNDLTEILQQTIQKYAAVPVISAVMDSSTDISAHLQAIFDIFPAAFFLISNDLYREPEHFKSAKLLQIAGIASSITRRPDQDAHIRLFIDSIDLDDSQEELNRKVSDLNTDATYIPKIIFTDFSLIRKKYKNLVITKDIHELIVMIFGFQGLLQIFLKYYFELICSAKSDETAKHIDMIFSNLFATLKYQEIKFWNNYSDSRKLNSELYHIIKMDSPSQRHPVLRNHLFDSLRQYNPIFKDARSRYTAPDVRMNHMQQLNDYNLLSVPRLALLLRTTNRCKGRSNLVYLLSQTLKSQNQKLYQLNKYIKAEENKSDKELVELVQYFVDKLSQTQKRANLQSSNASEMGTVIQTAESLRKLKAKKLLKEKEARVSLTYEQANHLMQDKFKKMYQQAKTHGVLTINAASDHLTQFASISQPLLALPIGDARNQAIKEFQISTEQMLKDIADRGHLTAEEIKAFQLKVSEKNRELMSSDLNSQTAIMEQIGMEVASASNQSQKRYQIKIKQSKAKKLQQPALTHDQVSQFLERRLNDLYKRVKKDGALTQNMVADYLSKFSEAAQPLMLEMPVDQQLAEIENFKVSTDDILKGFSRNGTLSDNAVNRYRDEIQQLTIQLKTPDVEKRSELIQEIGITLTNASDEADLSKSRGFGNKGPSQLYSNALTQDQIPGFLKEYLHKLYERVRKDGALTYDQVSSYLAKFADAAQSIVIEIPAAIRKQTIAEFKVSTDEILANLSREGALSQNQFRDFKIRIHGKMDKLDIDSVQERIQVVDQIGLILADASDASTKKTETAFDEEFYKKDIIPYGLDATAKLISMNHFFAFPFGDRQGPREDDWFNFHVRYLQLAMEKSKLEKSMFEKISAMLPAVPKKKYRKYFNIFPSEKFEETTFLAVYDLWQNRALDKLVVET